MNISGNNGYFAQLNRATVAFSPALLARYSQAAELPGEEPRDVFTPSSRGEDLGVYKRFVVGDNGNQVKTGNVPAEAPKTDKELRAFYATQAPHHELIGKGQFAEAGEAYREDAAGLKKDDPRRAELLARASQLEYAAKMQNGKNKVSFPPTLEEVKAHFKGLRKAGATEVSKEFRGYVNAFYQHIQDLDPSADVVYDKDGGGKVRGESKPVATFTPDEFSDVTDKRALNGSNQRLIDCEGYAFLGEQLLGQAGFHQGKEGSHMLMLGKKDGDTQHSHLMLFLKRDSGEALYVSNNHAYESPGPALEEGMRALKLPFGKAAEMYYGKSEREALAHANAGNSKYLFDGRW